MAESTLRLGAVREKLIANGYTPESALDPELPEWRTSEHPVAVTGGANPPLAAIVFTPPKDAELAQRIRQFLDKRGLTAGPCRTGSDGRILWPLRNNNDRRWHSAIGNAVVLERCSIPLDGDWSPASLLDIPYTKLPALEDALALFRELDSLPYELAAEKRPPPKPSRRAFIGEL